MEGGFYEAIWCSNDRSFYFITMVEKDTQTIEALNHNAVFSRGKVYLEFLFPHSAVLLFAFIVAIQRRAAQMCEYSSALRVLDTMSEEKINRIRFGQILTNQASPFKRKTITKSS